MTPIWRQAGTPEVIEPHEVAIFRYSSVKNDCTGILLTLTKRIVSMLVAPSQLAGQPDQQFGVGQ